MSQKENELSYELSSQYKMATEFGDDYRRALSSEKTTQLLKRLFEIGKQNNNSLVTRLVMTALSQLCTQNGRVGKFPTKDAESKLTNHEYGWVISGKETPYTSIMSLLDFYNGDKSGLPWCDSFVDYLFLMATGDIKRTEELIFQTGERKHGASSNSSYDYYDNGNAIISTSGEPKIGDQVFFYSAKRDSIAHTGIVVAVDDEFIYTIEGNTLADAYIEHNNLDRSSDRNLTAINGYAVFLKQYPKTSNKIAGYGRPPYIESEKMPPTLEYVVNQLIIQLYNEIKRQLLPKYPEYGKHTDYELDPSIIGMIINNINLRIATLRTKIITILEDRKTMTSSQEEEEIKHRQEEEEIKHRQEEFEKLITAIDEMNANKNEINEKGNENSDESTNYKRTTY